MKGPSRSGHAHSRAQILTRICPGPRLAPSLPPGVCTTRRQSNIALSEPTCHAWDPFPPPLQGYPTIKFFGQNKRSPEDYNGGRDSGSIVAWGNSKFAAMVSRRRRSRGRKGWSRVRRNGRGGRMRPG